MGQPLCLGYETARIAWRRACGRVACDNEPVADDPEAIPLLERVLFHDGEGIALGSLPQPTSQTGAPARVEVDDVARLISTRTVESYGPVQALVSEQRGRRGFGSVRTCLLKGELPAGSFVELPSGLVMPSPELQFVLMGRVLDVASLAAYGCELCGYYALSEGAPMGFVSCVALTSTSRISEYLVRLGCARSHQGTRMPNGSGVATRALAHVVDGAASPAEASCALLLSLPRRLGGYGLPKPELNRPIRLEPEMAELMGCDTLVCDLRWPGTKTLLEYAGGLHKLPSRAVRDRRKSNVLQSAGYEVIEAGREELMDRVAMDGVASMVARSIGVRLSSTDPEFFERQVRLRRAILPGPGQQGRATG